MELRIVPASAGTWAGVRRVMETPGDPAVCWCQVFRVPRDDWDARPVDLNRAELESLVNSPRSPGLVAYDADDPVGWVGVAPLADLVRVRDSAFFTDARSPDDDLAGRWCVSCFVVREEARGRGLVASLLAAAIDHARAQGAAAVEGFPLDPDRADEIGPDELFAGTVALFAAQGFTPRGELGPSRTLMVREL